MLRASTLLLVLAAACDPAAADLYTQRGAPSMPPVDGSVMIPDAAPIADAGTKLPDDAGTPPLDATTPVDAATGDPLGNCTGTPEECEAARVINEYRASHIHAGECNEPLRWNDTIGRLAHEHQSGPFVGHSSHGYVENVGQNQGVRATAEYIIQHETFIEEHCAANGSYTVSHHCAAMFCNNKTVGIGVFESGGNTYMTMMFADENGQPSW